MATIKDVSREAGLSIGTVSRVMNNRGYISEQTRHKVEEAMKKLHYQPNEVARALSKQTSTIIAVVVPKLDNPYFSSLSEWLEEFITAYNYQMLVFVSNGNTEKEEEIIEQCRKNRVAGIILCSGLFSLSSVKDLDCPLVTIERDVDTAGAAAIKCDNYEGGVLAAQLLINKGCRYLLHLSGVVGTIMPADKRAQGFIDTCNKNNVAHFEVPFSEELYEKMEYVDFLEEIFALHPDIDGVFASNDIIASQVLQVCANFHYDVPGKIKIVGFDDIPLASWTIPMLTTIKQPIKEMAEVAVKILIEAKGGKIIPKDIKMAVKLIERGTT